ncbi:MAG TPA: YceI family protein [Casimicrobiaceae bacterium]
MSTATFPLEGTFAADPIHSSFGFAVKHMGVNTFRGTLGDVSATLNDGVLEGAAKVESISITTPEEFRAHVLSPEFFDAAAHPEVTFRSTALDLREDGTATVSGELTIKGITREVTGAGTWQAPVPAPWGDAVVGSLELSAQIDRRDFGMTWNAPLPKGGNILAEQVTLNIHVELQGQA